MSALHNELTFRVAGVPEHFNAPWYIALEEGDFDRRPYDVVWRDFPGGTGAMCAALREGEVEIAVLLADGVVSAILKGLEAKIIGTYVDSPLYWGIHVPAQSPYTKPEELAGLPFAISRFGSGSHLMTFVEADARGWLQTDDPTFVKVGNIEGARSALREGEAVGFLWERLMTKPLVDAGEWRQIGVRPSPWPAFLIAAREDVIEAHAEKIQDMLLVIQRRCHDMQAARERTTAYLSKRFHLEPDAIQGWLDETRWRCAPEVSAPAIEETIRTLHRVGVIEQEASVEELVAEQMCGVGQVLPEALYDLRVGGVRDALSQAGSAFGKIDYEKLAQLGQFDRYYDYGTASCALAAEHLGLDESNRVLEVGSRLGAIARYLSHHTGCEVTGIEIQPALGAMARELTARCDMDDKVHCVTGDVTTIDLSQGAPLWDTLLSFMVMLHLKERPKAWENLVTGLKPGASVFVEDLVLLQQDLTPEVEEQIISVLKAPNLVGATAYKAEMRGAGLREIVCTSLTDTWVTWTQVRYEQFLAERDFHLSIHGAEVFEARRLFLHVMRDLFAQGILGSARFEATY